MIYMSLLLMFYFLPLTSTLYEIIHESTTPCLTAFFVYIVLLNKLILVKCFSGMTCQERIIFTFKS